jgi:hypothetical protein
MGCDGEHKKAVLQGKKAYRIGRMSEVLHTSDTATVIIGEATNGSIHAVENFIENELVGPGGLEPPTRPL